MSTPLLPQPPELAVFMTKGEAHPYWSTPEALAWATHPIGPAPGQPEVLRLRQAVINPEGELEQDNGDASGQDGGASDDQEGNTPGESEDPTGVVCWFHDTGRSIIIGFADFRYVLCLDPNQGPSLQRQAYQGPVRGWQPSARCPSPLPLVHKLDGISEQSRKFMEGLVEQSRSALAGIGPQAMVLQNLGVGRASLQPDAAARSTGRVLITRDDIDVDELSAEISLHRRSAMLALEWLYARFRRAQRRHPTLGNLVAWAHTQTRKAIEDLTKESVSEALAVRELAWLAHPGTPLLGVNELLLPPGWSSSERQCADLLMEGWDHPERRLAMPSKAAARWWLGLDERSRRLMVRWILVENEHKRLGALCHLLAPLGPLSVSVSKLRLLAAIPTRWLMAACLGQGRGPHGQDIREAFSDIKRWDIKGAVELAQTNPDTCDRAVWLTRQIMRLPASKTTTGSDGAWPARDIVYWLFDLEKGQRLLLIEKGWTWASLERLYHRWCLDEESALDIYVADKGLQEWDCLVERHTQNDIEVIPLCGRKQLTAAGHRYSNCMRQGSHREDLAMQCIHGAAQMFLIRTQEAHAMVKITLEDRRTWSVAECRGLTNSIPGPRIYEIAQDLARQCSLTDTPERREAKPIENQLPVCLKTLQARLIRWLADRPGVPRITVIGDKVYELKCEEVAGADGFLPLLLARVTVVSDIPSGVSITQVGDYRALTGSAVESISGDPLRIELLLRRIQEQWIKLEKESEPGCPDLGRWRNDLR